VIFGRWGKTGDGDEQGMLRRRVTLIFADYVGVPAQSLHEPFFVGVSAL